jgi:hypothetical protein
MVGECPHVPKILMVGQSIFLKEKPKKKKNTNCGSTPSLTNRSMNR